MKYRDLIITKIQKFFQTDLSYVIKHGQWLLGNNLISSAISFFMALAFANLLPKYDYGIYQYVLSMAALLAIPTLSGINTSFARAVAQGKEGDYYSTLRTKIKWSFIGTTASLVFSLYYFFVNNNLLGTGFLIVALAIPLGDTFSHYVSFLHGKKLFSKVAIYEIVNQFIVTVALIVTLFFTDSIISLLFVYFSFWIIVRIFSYYKVGHEYKPNKITDPEVIKYGKHLTVNNIISTISSSLDKVLIWHFLGPVEVSVYIFSMTIPSKVSGFLKIMNRLAFPKFSQHENFNHSLILKKILKVILFIIPIYLVYFFVVPVFFNLFLHQYTDSIPYAQALGLIFLFQPVYLILTYLTAQNKLKDLYIYNLLSPIFRIVMFLIFIPLYGIWGAVITTIASKIIDSIILIRIR